MQANLPPTVPATQYREGTALRASGKKTAARIVAAAYELLQTGGYETFSMRNIAERAGIRLGNLQYYYNKREDLIRALLDYVRHVYNERYARILGEAPDSPQGRFEAVIRWNLYDVGSIETRHFFIQLWPLLSTADEYRGQLLAELYQPQHAHLQERILELVPEMDPDEAHLRAEIIAATIEGFTVTAPQGVDSPQHHHRLRELAVRSAFQIARGGAAAGLQGTS